MDERQMTDELRILDIEIVLRHLLGCELALVRDGLRGEGVDVESAFGAEHGGCFFFGHFADAKEFTFKVSEG